MAQERKVPVLRSDNSLIEQEFDAVRDKFEVEMRRMEEEMARFRSQMVESEKSRLVSSTTTTTTTSTSSSSRLEEDKRVEEETPGSGRQSRASSSRCSSRSTVISAFQTAQEEQQELMRRLKQQELEAASRQAQQLSKHDRRTTAGPGSGSGGWLSELNSPLIKDSGDGRGKILKLRFDVTQYEPDQIVVKTVDNRLQVHAKREQISENTSMYREYNREFLLPDGINPELIKSSLSADGVLTVEAPLPPESGALTHSRL